MLPSGTPIRPGTGSPQSGTWNNGRPRAGTDVCRRMAGRVLFCSFGWQVCRRVSRVWNRRGVRCLFGGFGFGGGPLVGVLLEET